ncbi:MULTISPECIES: hypothetical protein [unclassified Natrinema]|uniref:hypothetical protein n=1 Tax=unclassified Natrinema TaxID=2622230 RepID=UPI00026D486A|nr:MULTISPECIES: hypothetical protein [unclassified Natrinema]AFO57037.1 hypothetical protein NJ7G_1795 [Natrinema sp. J7-2]
MKRAPHDGADLFDDPLEIERAFLQISGSGGDVTLERNVEYDHNPGVEFDARAFLGMVEASVDFEELGYDGRAVIDWDDESLREFIEAVAPYVGLRVERMGRGDRDVR